MKLNSIKNALTSSAGRKVLQVRKSSPTLMFGAGIVGMVGTVVLASKATLKLEAVIEETESNITVAKGLRESNHPDYSERDYQQDITKLYVRQTLKITKLYGPAFTLGVISVGCLTGAHVTLNRRNAGLVAAYATLDKGFKEYRERVLSEVGEDRERELRFGTQEVEVQAINKKGEPVTKTITAAKGTSMYARFFDESNQNWSVDPETNLFFLRGHQNYLNHQLQARGHVFLNEVFDALGMDRTSAGAVVGWVKGHGDDHIDFNLFSDDRMLEMHAFMTGHEKALLLDFNVDGVIYDII